MTAGSIILWITIAAFAAIALWIATEGTRLRWPKGRRVVALYHDVKVIAFFGANLDNPGYDGMYAHQAARAAYVTCAAWRAKIGDASNETPHAREIAVAFYDDSHFDGSRWSQVAASYLTRVRRMIGADGPPLIVIREKHRATLALTGEPVIHEICHLLLEPNHGFDRNHTDARVWEAHGTETVQFKAQQYYKNGVPS